ncbi:MAG: CpsB/CapC family capsule biosynthesis tyrosine phosphatase [Salegentibacter sp.]
MLSIFQKKKFLSDYLEGFTDFHNHLLPGIDDGSENVQDSLEMIRKFNEFGVKNFVATPHVMGEYYPNTPESIQAALEELLPALPQGNHMKAAAEYLMDQHFIDTLEKNEILPVSGDRVLVEMSFFQAPINLHEILFKLQNRGYRPILAHPERYAFYHSKDLSKYEELKSRGCSFQLNMLSLTGHYGTGIQKTAFQLLERNMIDYLSSDTHRLEHLEKVATIRLSQKKMEKLVPVIEKSKSLF